jgi:hypothetical protein
MVDERSSAASDISSAYAYLRISVASQIGIWSNARAELGGLWLLTSRRLQGAWRRVDIGSRFGGLPVGLLLVGIVCRLALSPYTSWSNDTAVWFHTSLSGFDGLHLYDRPGFAYPPLWGYYLQALGLAVRVAGFSPMFFGVNNPDFLSTSVATGDFSTIVTAPLYNLLFKSGLLVFDVATGLLIFRFVLLVGGSVTRAKLAFCLWFLNPFVIYESAVQGAWDGLVGFFVLATIVLILDARPLGAGVALVLGVMTKLSPLVLGLPLILAIAVAAGERNQSVALRVRRSGLFVLGSFVTLAALLLPEAVFGSIPSMLHSVFVRSQLPVIIGGLSLAGVRYLRPFSWLLDWAYANSATIVHWSSIAQFAAIGAWAVWTFIVARESRVFGVFTGVVGTLASVMLFSPISNPQYVLWWLPALVVIVALTGRGYWQLAVISVAALAFALAILGPYAVLAPLATYTRFISTSAVANNVTSWYTTTAGPNGGSYGDIFFGPAALGTITSLIWLFADWVGLAVTHRESRLSATT